MRTVVLLLAGSLWAAPDEPAIRLPDASEAKKAPEGAVVVRLTATGDILVDRDGKPARVTLEGLAEWLGKEIEQIGRASCRERV